MSSDSHEFKRLIEEVKARLPVESLVRSWGKEPVQRSNRLWACCPLHEEDTPSFAIGPDPGLWYCFGACSTGGDVLQLLELRLGGNFMDALQAAAEMVGMEQDLEALRRKRRGGGRENGDHDPGLALLDKAKSFYADALKGSEGRAAREYLQERGFDSAVIESFGLGFAPRGSQIARRLQAKGERDVELGERVGLIRRREDGSAYDFFYDRLMIPIRDDRGRTVGFGARLLPGAEGPKYVNTSETDWFKKGAVIYAYDSALAHARKQQRMILVEGYTDVMALHAAGLRETVAVLGTATTEAHARLVKRTGARTVILLFDGDEAGRKAAAKALLGLLPLDIELKVVRIDGGQDPADVVARGGAAAMEAQLENAMPWDAFMVEGLRDTRGRARVAELKVLFGLLEVLPSATLADEALRLASQELQIDYKALRDDYENHRRGKPGTTTGGSGTGRTGTGGRGTRGRHRSADVGGAEGSPDHELFALLADLFAAVLVEVDLFPAVRRCLDAHLPATGRAIFDAMSALWDADEDPTPSAVLSQLGEDPARQKVLPLVERARGAESPQEIVDRALEKIDELVRGRCSERVMNAIRAVEDRSAAGDAEAASKLPELLALLQEVRRGGALPEPAALDGLLGPFEQEEPGTDEPDPHDGPDGPYGEAAPAADHEAVHDDLPPDLDHFQADDSRGDGSDRTSAA